jgi:hypothetical protein
MWNARGAIEFIVSAFPGGVHQKDTTIFFDHTVAGIVAERRKSRKLSVSIVCKRAPIR